jgi:hypothetical protein
MLIDEEIYPGKGCEGGIKSTNNYVCIMFSWD